MPVKSWCDNMQFFASELKHRSFQKIILDIVASHNDHPSYVKQALGSIYVVFSLFGYWVCPPPPPQKKHPSNTQKGVRMNKYPLKHMLLKTLSVLRKGFFCS